MADGVGLHALDPRDPGLRVQISQPGGAHVAQRDGAGEARLLLATGRCAEDVVEHQGCDSPMDVSGRTFVGRAEMEVGEHAAAVALPDHQRRCHRISLPRSRRCPTAFGRRRWRTGRRRNRRVARCAVAPSPHRSRPWPRQPSLRRPRCQSSRRPAPAPTR